MDGGFEILIPSDADLHPFDFMVPMFEWQGVKYPQGPPECNFGTNFQLKMIEGYDIKYVKSFIPSILHKAKWLPIDILGKGIDVFHSVLHGFLDEEEKNFSFADLLNTLLKDKTHWIVIYSHQYDGFSNVLSGQIEDILPSFVKFSDSGMLIYKGDFRSSELLHRQIVPRT